MKLLFLLFCIVTVLACITGIKYIDTLDWTYLVIIICLLLFT